MSLENHSPKDRLRISLCATSKLLLYSKPLSLWKKLIWFYGVYFHQWLFVFAFTCDCFVWNIIVSRRGWSTTWSDFEGKGLAWLKTKPELWGYYGCEAIYCLMFFFLWGVCLCRPCKDSGYNCWIWSKLFNCFINF